jgi:hypothetical protein
MSRFAVAQCGCGNAWAVELRHAQAACPRCGAGIALEKARIAWRGDSAVEAQVAVGQLRLRCDPRAEAAVASLRRASVPRHDSPVEAAAARGAGIANKSSRAELVALALSRLTGMAPHDDLVQALELAGLERRRADAEVVRMLAMDILLEPKAGHYRVVEDA